MGEPTNREELKRLLDVGLTDPGLAAHAYALATLILCDEIMPVLETVLHPLVVVEGEHDGD